MATNYSIDVNPRQQLLEVRLSGQWTVATVASYRLDVDAALARMQAQGGRPGEYLLLVDMREQGVQSREVAAAYQAFISDYAWVGRRRATIVSGSALHELQVKRVAKELDVENAFFRTEEEALGWLFA